MTTIDEAAATQRPATEIPTLKRRPCEACAVDVLIAAGTQIVLDARELTPLEPCPRCQLESRTRPAAPGPAPRRDVALRADLSPHHGSVALQHRACCAAKGRDPVACVCDPRAYLVVDHKHIRAGRLPVGWSAADVADLTTRLPPRHRRANVQLRHQVGCDARGRDHERCSCGPRAYLSSDRGRYVPAGRLARGWTAADVAALLEPLVDGPVAADQVAARVVDDHVVAELPSGACSCCRGRGAIGEPIGDGALYAIDDAGDVRPIRLDERSAGDALHREHAITCQTCSIAQAEAA